MLGALSFVVVVSLLAYALLRRRRPDEHRAPGSGVSARSGGSSRPAIGSSRPAIGLLAGGGVVLPVVLISAVFVWSLGTMREIPTEVPDGALVISVTAHQFWWEVDYEDSDARATDLIVIPVGHPVALLMESEDVIHSLWIPDLAGKVDILPDYTNTLIFEASEAGTYRGSCAEFCGVGHAAMDLEVIALPPDEFSDWLAAAESEEARDDG